MMGFEEGIQKAALNSTIDGLMHVIVDAAVGYHRVEFAMCRLRVDGLQLRGFPRYSPTERQLFSVESVKWHQWIDCPRCGIMHNVMVANRIFGDTDGLKRLLMLLKEDSK